jgi:transglutaminase-like putative cysteine protease
MLLNSSPPSAFLASIPDGLDGIAATMRVMAQIVRQWRTHPEIITPAREIVAEVPGKDYYGEAAEVFDYVQSNVRYVRDVDGVETVQTPLVTLAQAAGDCDDMATLLATLLSAIGHPTRFVAAAFNGNPDLEHVWTETKIGPSWYAADPTEQVEFGWRPPRISSRLIQWI